MRRVQTALAALLLAALPPLSGCATMGQADPTAGLDNADVARRVLENGDVIEEYRVAGQLRVVKVSQEIGPTYYLIDSNGDGLLDQSEGEGPVSPVYWKLFEWN